MEPDYGEFSKPYIEREFNINQAYLHTTADYNALELIDRHGLPMVYILGSGAAKEDKLYVSEENIELGSAMYFQSEEFDTSDSIGSKIFKWTTIAGAIGLTYKCIETDNQEDKLTWLAGAATSSLAGLVFHRTDNSGVTEEDREWMRHGGRTKLQEEYGDLDVELKDEKDIEKILEEGGEIPLETVFPANNV